MHFLIGDNFTFSHIYLVSVKDKYCSFNVPFSLIIVEIFSSLIILLSLVFSVLSVLDIDRKLKIDLFCVGSLLFFFFLTGFFSLINLLLISFNLFNLSINGSTVSFVSFVFISFISFVSFVSFILTSSESELTQIIFDSSSESVSNKLLSI